jgi:hypothetical protein
MRLVTTTDKQNTDSGNSFFRLGWNAKSEEEKA